MSDRAAHRHFLRLVIAVSIASNAVALAVVQGEHQLRPFTQGSTLDGHRLELTNDLLMYGTTVQVLHERVRSEVEP